jgi:hypothetical protein
MAEMEKLRESQAPSGLVHVSALGHELCTSTVRRYVPTRTSRLALARVAAGLLPSSKAAVAAATAETTAVRTTRFPLASRLVSWSWAARLGSRNSSCWDSAPRATPAHTRPAAQR